LSSVETVLKTTDAGVTWLAYSTGSIETLKSLYFTDANTGFIAGNNGTILKTTDGGINWTALSSGSTSDLNSIYFPAANTGFAVGYNMSHGTILKTTDAGLTWSNTTTELYQELSSVYFSDVNTGYAAGNWGTILKTTDSGDTWTTLSSGTRNFLTSVFFTTANSGYVVGWVGTILHTSDGGTDNIDEHPAGKISFDLYPNPSNNNITISGNKTPHGEYKVSIFNLVGTLLIGESFCNQKEVHMDVRNLTKGVYLVKIQTSSGVEAKKLVIQ